MRASRVERFLTRAVLQRDIWGIFYVPFIISFVGEIVHILVRMSATFITAMNERSDDAHNTKNTKGNRLCGVWSVLVESGDDDSTPDFLHLNNHDSETLLVAGSAVCF